MNDFQKQRAYGDNPESKTFDSITPIRKVVIPGMNQYIDEVSFSSYEELHYYLKCQNTMGLANAIKHIDNAWTIDGMGSESLLFSKNGEHSPAEPKEIPVVYENIVDGSAIVPDFMREG